MGHDFLEVTKKKFWQQIEGSAPIFATFQLTHACNLYCKYCGGDYRDPLPDELTPEETQALIENLKRAGLRYLSLGGGEPTLRKDLVEIVSLASSGMGVGMVTNGLLLTYELASRLRDAGLSVIDISLDGATAESNDSRRGRGSFERGIQAIENSKKAGIPVIDLQTTISQLNYAELPQLIRLAMDLGISIVVNEFVPFGRAQARKDLLLSKEQRQAMQRFLLEQQRIFGRQQIKFDGYYIISEDERAKQRWADPLRKDLSVGDPFGIYGFNISPNGKLIPTVGLEIADLRRQELREVWRESEILWALRDRERLKGKCGRCEYRYVCGGDRRRTHALTGDLLAEDPLCWYEPSSGQ